MLSYDTAVKLKKAGFEIPFNSRGLLTCKAQALAKEQNNFVSCDHSQCMLQLEEIYVPTLEELIDACGADGIFLWKYEGAWCASRIDPSYDCFTDEYIDEKFSPKKGPIPSEAVANLYLALHSK